VLHAFGNPTGDGLSWHQHAGGADGVGKAHVVAHSVRVIQLCRRESDVLLLDLQDVPPESRDRAGDVMLEVDDPLWEPRRATAEQPEGDVVAVCIGRGQFSAGPRHHRVEILDAVAGAVD
jgi:hypothetical protein